MIKVVVTGGREYFNRVKVYDTLNKINATQRIEYLIAGCASGADALALTWADTARVNHVKFFAKWKVYGPPAGPKRNLEMLELLGPNDLVVAFPGNKGTADCINQAKRLGLTVKEIKDGHSRIQDEN